MPLRQRLAPVLLGLGMALLSCVAADPARAADPVEELAQAYAPVVVVRDHPAACGDGEPYLPTPVDSVLGKADVTLIGPGGERITAPTAVDLAGKGDGWYLDMPGNPLAPGCDYEKWFASAADGTPATVYAHIATDPDHPGMLALQYWFFWAYNDWNDKHEGDWEMIQLLFEASSAEEALAGPGPVSTAYAQHEGSEVSDWTDPKLSKVGNHVVVYPGQGSHAAYYTQADWFGRSAAAGFGCDNTTALGRELTPEVIVIPQQDTQLPPWLTFTGRWGEKAPSFNNGPTGPNMKTQWTQPVTWQMEEGRPGAVALPALPGPAGTSFCLLSAAGSQLFIYVLDHPVLTIVAILVLIVVIVLLVRATRWRGSDWREPDRERRAGQIVGASFGLLFGRWRSLWPVIVIMGLASAGMLALNRLALVWLPRGELIDVRGLAWSDGISLRHVLSLLAILLVTVVGSAIVALAMVATTRIVDHLSRGEQPSPWRELQQSITYPAAALVMLILFYAVTLLGSTLLGLPVAIVLIALFAVAMPATAIERLGVVGGFRRSLQLTKGRWPRAVLLSALLIGIGFVLPGMVGGILLLLTGWPFWATNLISLVVGAFLASFAAIGLTLQYYDFRQEERRDAEVPAQSL